VGIAEMNKYLPDQHTIHFDPAFGSSVLYLTGNHCLQFMHTQTVVVNIRKKFEIAAEMTSNSKALM
jgi:hypothetical protein